MVYQGEHSRLRQCRVILKNNALNGVHCQKHLGANSLENAQEFDPNPALPVNIGIDIEKTINGKACTPEDISRLNQLQQFFCCQTPADRIIVICGIELFGTVDLVCVSNPRFK